MNPEDDKKNSVLLTVPEGTSIIGHSKPGDPGHDLLNETFNGDLTEEEKDAKFKLWLKKYGKKQ